MSIFQYGFKGVDELDQIFTVLLKTSMAVGGIIACLLDNLIPGTPEERGIRKWRKLATGQTIKNVASIHVYDLPFGVANKWEISKFVPFLPHYDELEENSESVENGVETGVVNMATDVQAETPQAQNTKYSTTTML